MPHSRRVRYRETTRTKKAADLGNVTMVVVPQCVLDERDHVLSQPRSLNQELLGDPLAGRSVLDRRQR